MLRTAGSCVMGVVWELKKTLGVVQMWLGWKVVRVETRSLKFLGRSFALTWGETQ